MNKPVYHSDNDVSDVPDSEDLSSPHVDSISVEECERFCPCQFMFIANSELQNGSRGCWDLLHGKQTDPCC